MAGLWGGGVVILASYKFHSIRVHNNPVKSQSNNALSNVTDNFVTLINLLSLTTIGYCFKYTDTQLIMLYS